MINKKPIFVTKPYLGSLKDYTQMLEIIWDSGILTNGGQFVNEFEKLI